MTDTGLKRGCARTVGKQGDARGQQRQWKLKAGRREESMRQVDLENRHPHIDREQKRSPTRPKADDESQASQ
jgi:hypothetical protein